MWKTLKIIFVIVLADFSDISPKVFHRIFFHITFVEKNLKTSPVDKEKNLPHFFLRLSTRQQTTCQTKKKLNKLTKTHFHIFNTP